MNRIKAITVAVLVAALPFTPAAFASDRGQGDRGHGYGHNQHGYGGHHHRHHYRHGHHHGTGHYSHGGHGAQVVLPFPPLPPFPVIVLNKKHHDAHAELRRPYR
jgi:hypothetical protein